MIKISNINIPIPKELRIELKKRALETNSTLKDFIIQILKEGVKNEK